jgi:DNA polymerase-4
MKRIIHVDMDAFFASVEQRDNPALRGRPVVVGGDPSRRGVVAAASYEARQYGIHSAMAMAKAVRLCPSLLIVRPSFAKYSSVSGQVFAILREVTELVEPLSLDEAYLDVTQNAWGEPLATNVARRIKQRIKDEVGLTASAGVAPNKFLAKVASGWNKPDGLTVIPPERVEAFLQQLPVDALWGVGPVTARRLRSQGLTRAVDLRGLSLARLRELVGSQAVALRSMAFGLDDRPIVPLRARKSSGTETTFAVDLLDLPLLRSHVATMAARAADWLEAKLLFARTVTLKLRYSDFTTITRSVTTRPTRDRAGIVAAADALLERTEAGRRPVRLVGVSVSNFAEGVAEDLLPGDLLPFELD